MTSFKYIKKDADLLLVIFHWIWDTCGVYLIENDEQFTFKIINHPLSDECEMLLSELSDRDFSQRILEYITPEEYQYFRMLDLNVPIQGDVIPFIEMQYKDVVYDEEAE